MTKLEQTIMLEISTLPWFIKTLFNLTAIRQAKFNKTNIFQYIRKLCFWKRVRARAKELNITQEDIDAEIRAVRAGK